MTNILFILSLVAMEEKPVTEAAKMEKTQSVMEQIIQLRKSVEADKLNEALISRFSQTELSKALNDAIMAREVEIALLIGGLGESYKKEGIAIADKAQRLGIKGKLIKLKPVTEAAKMEKAQSVMEQIIQLRKTVEAAKLNETLISKFSQAELSKALNDAIMAREVDIALLIGGLGESYKKEGIARAEAEKRLGIRDKLVKLKPAIEAPKMEKEVKSSQSVMEQIIQLRKSVEADKLNETLISKFSQAELSKALNDAIMAREVDIALLIGGLGESYKKEGIAIAGKAQRLGIRDKLAKEKEARLITLKTRDGKVLDVPRDIAEFFIAFKRQIDAAKVGDVISIPQIDNPEFLKKIVDIAKEEAGEKDKKGLDLLEKLRPLVNKLPIREKLRLLKAADYLNYKTLIKLMAEEIMRSFLYIPELPEDKVELKLKDTWKTYLNREDAQNIKQYQNILEKYLEDKKKLQKALENNNFSEIDQLINEKNISPYGLKVAAPVGYDTNLLITNKMPALIKFVIRGTLEPDRNLREKQRKVAQLLIDRGVNLEEMGPDFRKGAHAIDPNWWGGLRGKNLGQIAKERGFNTPAFTVPVQAEAKPLSSQQKSLQTALQNKDYPKIKELLARNVSPIGISVTRTINFHSPYTNSKKTMDVEVPALVAYLAGATEADSDIANLIKIKTKNLNEKALSEKVYVGSEDSTPIDDVHKTLQGKTWKELIASPPIGIKKRVHDELYRALQDNQYEKIKELIRYNTEHKLGVFADYARNLIYNVEIPSGSYWTPERDVVETVSISSPLMIDYFSEATKDPKKKEIVDLLIKAGMIKLDEPFPVFKYGTVMVDDKVQSVSEYPNLRAIKDALDKTGWKEPLYERLPDYLGYR